MLDVPNDFIQYFDHVVHFDNGNRSEYYSEYRVGYFVGSSFRWRLITQSESAAIEYVNKNKEYQGHKLYLMCFSLLASFHNLDTIEL